MITTGNQENLKIYEESLSLFDGNRENTSQKGEDKNFSSDSEKKLSQPMYKTSYLETNMPESIEFGVKFGTILMCVKFSTFITNMDLSGSSSLRNLIRSKNFHNRRNSNSIKNRFYTTIRILLKNLFR